LVVAATGPLDLSELEREAIGPSKAFRGFRTPSSRGLRGRLLRSRAGAQTFRGADDPCAEEDDWTVASVDLQLVRPLGE
jgi:hypothetical protein